MQKPDPPTDKRRHQRFTTEEPIIVAIMPQAEILGHLIDIGMGGLAFRYIDAVISESPGSDLLILKTKPRVYLERIPFRVVADLALPREYSLCSIPVRRRSIAFDRLSLKQHTRILSFIQHHVIARSRYRVDGTPDEKPFRPSPPHAKFH